MAFECLLRVLFPRSVSLRSAAVEIFLLFSRRFFNYMVPFRTAFAGYSNNQQNFSRELAVSHPELTLPMLAGISDCFVRKLVFSLSLVVPCAKRHKIYSSNVIRKFCLLV